MEARSGGFTEGGVRDYRDTEGDRLVRLRNQVALDGRPDLLVGKGAAERVRMVRERLFEGFDTVGGDGLAQLRRRNMHTRIDGEFCKFHFPDHSRLVGYQAALVRQLDGLAEGVSEIVGDQRREDTAGRLAALTFYLGTGIHPFGDGNGQTFREVGISWVWEFSEGSSDSWFPYYVDPRKEEIEITGDMDLFDVVCQLPDFIVGESTSCSGRLPEDGDLVRLARYHSFLDSLLLTEGGRRLHESFVFGDKQALGELISERPEFDLAVKAYAATEEQFMKGLISGEVSVSAGG